MKKRKLTGDENLRERLAEIDRRLRMSSRCQGLTQDDRIEIVNATYPGDSSLSWRSLDNRRRTIARSKQRDRERYLQFSESTLLTDSRPDHLELLVTRDLMTKTLNLLFEEMAATFQRLTPRAYNLLVEHYQLDSIFDLQPETKKVTKEAKRQALYRARKSLAKLMEASLATRESADSRVRELALEIVRGERYLEFTDYLEEVEDNQGG